MAGELALFLTRDGATVPCAFERDGEAIGLDRFRGDVAATVARLRVLDARRAIVACADTYWAAVAWFALAQHGGDMVLAPNALPSTLQSLTGHFDSILSDGAATQGERVLRLHTGPPVATALPPIDADRATVSLFTSGSTGTPKRITKTMRELELEAHALEEVLGLVVPATARIHATVTHQHLYGLTFRLCWPLAFGRTVVSRAEEFWESLLPSLHGGDVVVTSPSHLSRLSGLSPVPLLRRPSAVTSGGAPLGADAVQDCGTLLGCPVHEFFGSTEAGLIGNRVRDGSEAPWRPLPGATVERRADGRLHVRSPYISSSDGLTTDDLIEIDGAGFQLRGRADRIAKIEGVRVSLVEFEREISNLRGVAQAAIVVLGTDNPVLGAVVVLDPAGREELKAVGPFRVGRRLRSDLARTLPATALPRRWRFVQAMPEGPIGKSRAADLVALFEST